MRSDTASATAAHDIDAAPTRWDEARYASLVANVPGAVYRCAVTSEWDMEFMSQGIETLCGYPPSDFVGSPPIRTYASVIHPEDREMVEHEVERALDRGEPFRLDYRLVHASGDVRWVHERGRGVCDANGTVLYLDGAILDNNERQQLEQQLQHLAYHDSLTGLPNRALLREHVEAAIARGQRHGGSAAVVFLDVDDFKLVNDSFGHSTGDSLLCDLAARLRGLARATDIVSRQGGDEFMILVEEPEADKAGEAAEKLARRILGMLRQPTSVAGVDVVVGASIGITVFPADAVTTGDLLKCADVAMYQAKSAGGNGYRRYTHDDDAALTRLSLASRLRGAAERDEFVLHYQPIVELRSGRAVGVEALIRWRDPDRGLVSPAEFIPLAERTGLIEPISSWVISESCRQAAKWHREGLNLFMSINLTARCWEPVMLGRLMHTIRGCGLDPSDLMVEVTESAVMSNPENNEAIVSSLRERGLHFAIDDFGTGHSSLARLKHMLVDTLKIDMSFVRDVPDDPKASNLVAGIIQLADGQGLTALAEGVETPTQREFLVQHGCQLGQGFHFSRPVPAAEIPAYVARHP